jgi:integrase
VKTWALFYRTGGRQRFFTLGRYPDLTLGKAREAARKALAKARLGDDPHGEKLEARRQARKDADSGGIDAPVSRRLTAHTEDPEGVGAARRGGDYSSVRAVAGERPYPADVRGWAAKIAKRSTYTTNRAFEVLRRVFSWSIEQDVIGASPFVGLKLRAKEHKSERVLSADEVRASWRALDDVQVGHPDYADAARLLLLTGVRRDWSST